MRLIRKYLTFVPLLGLLLSVASPTIFINNAHASSVYDDLVKPVSSIGVSNDSPNSISDVSNSYLNIMQTKCNTAYNSLRQAMQNYQNGGRWAILQSGLYDMDTGAKIDTNLGVEIRWTISGGENFQIYWQQDLGVAAGTTSNDPDMELYTARIGLDSNGNYTCGSANTPYQNTQILDEEPYMEYAQPWYSTFDYDYPAGYSGTLVPNGQSIDSDGDGLNIVQEMQQQTSDDEVDSDGDGINDFKESAWFPDRDDIFCNTSVTPHVCAYPDPATKDIYAEIDWMQNGSTSYQPTSTQLSLAKAGLEYYGYKVHLDAGQYGGGNALPSYIQYLPFAPDNTSVNFFDLKDGSTTHGVSANFNPDRKGIWRYLVSGYGYDEDHSSSGATYAGSDNVFVSNGLIQANQSDFGYTDLDTAIAGTMVHELGHSLCLSSAQAYSYQSAACQFSGIDSSASSSYDSVMNYNLQMFQTNLSSGVNGSGDHDDWDAIDNDGIADFSNWTTSQLGLGLDKGLTIQQAKNANKAGTLGRLKKGNKVYDYRKNTVQDLKTGKISKI